MLDHILSSPLLQVMRMRDSNTQQNLTTCVYETKLAGLCRQVTVTWLLRGGRAGGMCVTVEDPICSYMCKVKKANNSWPFWKNNEGSRSFDMGGKKVEVHWDLSSAKYSCGPEPCHGFFVAVVCDAEMVLLLGDKKEEAFKKTRARPCSIDATLLLRREHIFGKKLFCTRASFDESGRAHDIAIECETSPPAATEQKRLPYLVIRVDKHLVVQVKNLEWKFRGNQTVIVDGVVVEILWDVHNWLFSPCNGDGGLSNAALFIFQSCSSITSSPTNPPEKKSTLLAAASCSSSSNSPPQRRKTLASAQDFAKMRPAGTRWFKDLNGSISVMKLAGSPRHNPPFHLSPLQGGSSLMLHAWRCEQ